MIFAGICAGGKGTRLNPDGYSRIPKQFLPLESKPVIVYSVESFLHCEEIEKIFVAVSEDFFEHCVGLDRKSVV